MNILMDLHTHTISSGHGYSTLQENTRENRDRARRANRPKDSADDNVLDFLLSNDQQDNEEVDDE